MLNKRAKLLLSSLLLIIITGCISTKDSKGSMATISDDHPSKNFDLSTWKLTLPISKENGSSAKEIKVPEMLAGYTSEYFYYNEEGAMVFYCPIGMASTINSNYSRSELRELIDGKNSDVNWTLHGTHNFSTRERVTQVPSNGRTVTSQIHGIYPDGTNGPVLVKVEYNGNEEHVVVLLKTATYKNAADERHYLRGIKLGEEYSTTIKVVEGRVFVTVTSGDKRLEASKNFYHDDPTWDNYRFYYKVGNYAQDSIKDYDGEAATVIVYEVETSHSDDIENITPTAINLPETITMEKGQDAALDVTFAPFDTSNIDCSWELVSGDRVVSLSKNGEITARAEGEAVIKAISLANPELSDTATISVVPKTKKEAKVVYENDFESTLGSEWELMNNENGTLGIKDGKLTFLDDEKRVSRKAVLNLDNLKGTTTVQFDVEITRLDIKDKGNAKEQSSYYYFDVNSASKDNLFRIRNKADVKGDKLVDPRIVLSRGYIEPKMNKEAAKTALGDTHTITMVIRTDDNSAKANTTDTYIDGIKIGDMIENNSKQSAIGRIEIFSGTKDLLDFNIDNLVVYEGVKLPEGAAPTEVTVEAVASVIELGGSTRIVTDGDTAFEVVSGKDVVTVSDSGLITGLVTGSATIKVGDNKMVDITVQEAVVKAEDLVISKDLVVLNLEESIDLDSIVSVLPANATEKGYKVRVTEGKTLISLDDKIVTGVNKGKVNLMISSLDDPSMIKFVNLTVVKKSNSVVEIMTFDDMAEGSQIDKASPKWSVDKVDGSTLLANVDATMASSAPNALYIFDDSPSNKPYALLAMKDGVTPSGSFSFDAFIPSNNPKTCYVNIGTGKNNANRYFELRLGSSGKLEYENSAGDVEVAKFSRDAWHTFTVEWADGAFSILIDGEMTKAQNIPVSSTGLNTSNIPTTVTFVAGDTKSTGTKFYIDNITSDLF